MGMADRVTLLDCTLRDGGYFNDWNFSREMAQDLMSALRRSGVDIIEVGFKSPHTHRARGFEGLFRYCNESLLSFLHDSPETAYSFMVDAKEFLKGRKLDPALVEECIPPKSASVFSWARVATYLGSLEGALDLGSALQEKGYRVTVNLMGMSLLGGKDLDRALRLVAGAEPDVFYFSDTFGDLTPDEIAGSMARIREHYGGTLGLHTHDNNGLAFANTLKAIEHGIDVIDSTVMGMGRGAGNLRTEQILLSLYFNRGYTHLNPHELLEVIDTHLVPLHRTYRWGWDYTYMLSALQNIHPMYCQNLRATNQYTIEQVSRILNSIDPKYRSAFDEHALLQAVDTVVNEPVVSREPLVEIPAFRPEPAGKVLVIATGPSRETYRGEIAAFITEHQPLVLECNPAGTAFEEVSDHYYGVILNWVRLRKALESPQPPSAPVITGLWGIPRSCAGRARVLRFACHISGEEFSVTTSGLTLPAYVVGMFSVGLALLSSPQAVYLAGFDGFPDRADLRHQEMEVFWKRVLPLSRMVSLTPTHYTVPMESVYRHIR